MQFLNFLMHFNSEEEVEEVPRLSVRHSLGVAFCYSECVAGMLEAGEG
jgi:hypothetical protein